MLECIFIRKNNNESTKSANKITMKIALVSENTCFQSKSIKVDKIKERSGKKV